jgi:putative FmdB family regulatory protein
MPTYQYRCTDCGHDLEAVQKFTDSALTECPNCRGQLRKVFNAVGVVFKGSGFYRNDSRPADATANGNGSKSESDTKIKTEAKSGSNGASDAGSSGGKKTDSGSGSKQPAAAGAAPSSTGAKTA